MATDVTMPRLSDSMEEGTILKWIVEEGGEVKREESEEEADDERTKASPVARRVANELGVDIADVQGSGPGGRILKADVEKAAEQDGGAPEKAPEKAEKKKKDKKPKKDKK